MIQEKLEEASLLSRPIHLIWDEDERYDCNEEFREEFKKGAKWKQERSYSEEEVKKAFQVGFNVGYNDETSPSYLTFDKWFNEFKKK